MLNAINCFKDVGATATFGKFGSGFKPNYWLIPNLIKLYEIKIFIINKLYIFLMNKYFLGFYSFHYGGVLGFYGFGWFGFLLD